MCRTIARNIYYHGRQIRFIAGAPLLKYHPLLAPLFELALLAKVQHRPLVVLAVDPLVHRLPVVPRLEVIQGEHAVPHCPRHEDIISVHLVAISVCFLSCLLPLAACK